MHCRNSKIDCIKLYEMTKAFTNQDFKRILKTRLLSSLFDFTDGIS